MEIAKAKVVMGAARNASGGDGCRAAAEGRSALMALPAHLKLDGTVAEMVEEAGLQLAKCR